MHKPAHRGSTAAHLTRGCDRVSNIASDVFSTERAEPPLTRRGTSCVPPSRSPISRCETTSNFCSADSTSPLKYAAACKGIANRIKKSGKSCRGRPSKSCSRGVTCLELKPVRKGTYLVQNRNDLPQASSNGRKSACDCTRAKSCSWIQVFWLSKLRGKGRALKLLHCGYVHVDDRL